MLYSQLLPLSVGGVGIVLLAIDGPAGSGKTTLAAKLQSEYQLVSSVQVIHMDDLYNGWEDALSEELTLKLAGIIHAHKSGLDFPLSKFNWATMKFDKAEIVHSTEILILEGVGAAQKLVRDAGAKTYWIETPAKIGLQRVLDRDGQHLHDLMLNWQSYQSAHFKMDKTAENCDVKLTS
jgi:uridine kinase